MSVTNAGSTFFESVVIKGRETHLLDDLEYTKAALGIKYITKPLVKAFEEELDRAPKKKRARQR